MSKLTANQQKWVDALRSGEFEQAHESLEWRGAYCCLGVACILAERDGVEVDRDSRGQLEGQFIDEQPAAMRWLGLRKKNGAFRPSDGGYPSLTRRNDQGYTFHEIADIIEAHADELFVATAEGEP